MYQFGIIEIVQAKTTVGKHNEIVRFDIVVHDTLTFDMRKCHFTGVVLHTASIGDDRHFLR